MKAGEGLQPSAKGTLVRYQKGKLSVTDGPFGEATALIAGYWLIHAKSRADAIGWAKKVPGGDGEIDSARSTSWRTSRSILPSSLGAGATRRRRCAAPTARPGAPRSRAQGRKPGTNATMS